MFEKTPIEFYSDAEDLENKEIPLLLGWSRELVLIFKEAMTNALKHSNATEVHLNLKLEVSSFVFTLADNGVGMDEDGRAGSVGLKSMRNRIKSLGGTIYFEKLEQGTQVRLIVPIPKTVKEFEI